MATATTAGEWEWWAGVEWEGDAMQCSGVTAGVGWGRARVSGVVMCGGVSSGGGHRDTGCLGGGRHHDVGARQQLRDASHGGDGDQPPTMEAQRRRWKEASCLEGVVHLDCWNRAGRKGGHTRWIDGDLVSRGEDVEVAITVGRRSGHREIGGGARCGRDFRGGGGPTAGLRDRLGGGAVKVWSPSLPTYRVVEI
jgi:hypothetical protein